MTSIEKNMNIQHPDTSSFVIKTQGSENGHGHTITRDKNIQPESDTQVYLGKVLKGLISLTILIGILNSFRILYNTSLLTPIFSSVSEECRLPDQVYQNP
jgi:hypothetical protein